MIEQFYSGKSLLITGCTGFVGKSPIFNEYLGKVLLEKVLRSLPSIKTIYVGISSKVSGHPSFRKTR
jgi:hypothetical protein